MITLIQPLKHSLTIALCIGAALLMAARAQSQNLYVTSFASDSIYQYSPGGAQIAFSSPLPLNGPAGLASDSAGNLYEADSGSGTIYKFSAGYTRTSVGEQYYAVRVLAVDGNGYVYEGDLGSSTINSGFVRKIAPGNPINQTTIGTGLNPSGLAVNSGGAVFVSDSLSGNIYEFASGVQTTFASGLSHPGGLAFNSAGDLFEADTGSGNIYEFTPGGGRNTFASGLSDPEALAFNSAGDLFESDAGSGHIYEFTPGGVRSTFLSGLDQPDGLAFASVPEPSTFALLTISAAVFLVRRKCSRLRPCD